MDDTDVRDSEIKENFIQYMDDHPELRFWQAVRNWSGYGFVYAGEGEMQPDGEIKLNVEDTFYWEGARAKK